MPAGRNIEPGTNDRVFQEGRDLGRLDLFDPDGRNISPGNEGMGTREHVHNKKKIRGNHTSKPIFNMEHIELMRLTGIKICPCRGCNVGEKGGPKEWDKVSHLRMHLRRQHKDLDEHFVLRTVNSILDIHTAKVKAEANVSS